jgi:hypothetical protein
VGGDIEEAESVPGALEQAGRMVSPAGIVVVSGSIYIVGEAMEALGIPI